MRGAKKILTVVVLLTSLTASAVIGALIFRAVARTMPKNFLVGLQWSALGLTVAFEVFRIPTLAINRQVPQWWGHRYGALAASGRYGLRMGIGPATILTSWFWWTGAVIGATTSTRLSVSCAVLFAATRFATMLAIAWQNPSGVEMAMRIRRVESWRDRSRIASTSAMALATIAVIGAHLL